MTVRIEIDLNVRVHGNLTYVGFEHVHGGSVHVGMSVEVYENESGLSGIAEVAEVDEVRELVYLVVDWASLGEHAGTAVSMSGGAGTVFSGPRRHTSQGSLSLVGSGIKLVAESHS